MLFTSLRGSGQGCPFLRASNEHILIVRVLRARRAPGRSLPILLRPRVARAQKIIRLHPLPVPRARKAPGRSPHTFPNVRSKKILVAVMCCSKSLLKAIMQMYGVIFSLCSITKNQNPPLICKYRSTVVCKIGCPRAESRKTKTMHKYSSQCAI